SSRRHTRFSRDWSSDVCSSDLVSEPANVLTTVEFAERLKGLEAHGVEVEILDEAALEALGMRTLLAVARGSESPARVVVMQWKEIGRASRRETVEASGAQVEVQ